MCCVFTFVVPSVGPSLIMIRRARFPACVGVCGNVAYHPNSGEVSGLRCLNTDCRRLFCDMCDCVHGCRHCGIPMCHCCRWEHEDLCAMTARSSGYQGHNSTCPHCGDFTDYTSPSCEHCDSFVCLGVTCVVGCGSITTTDCCGRDCCRSCVVLLSPEMFDVCLVFFFY